MTRDELTEWLISCRAIRPVVGGNYDLIAEELISAGLVTVTEPWKPEVGVVCKFMADLMGYSINVRPFQEKDGGWLVFSTASGQVYLARPDQLSPRGD
jgi:hypothetical protein